MAQAPLRPVQQLQRHCRQRGERHRRRAGRGGGADRDSDSDSEDFFMTAEGGSVDDFYDEDDMFDDEGCDEPDSSMRLYLDSADTKVLAMLPLAGSWQSCGVRAWHSAAEQSCCSAL